MKNHFCRQWYGQWNYDYCFSSGTFLECASHKKTRRKNRDSWSFWKYFFSKEQKNCSCWRDLVQHLFIFGKKAQKEDCEVTIIIGARTKDLLLLLIVVSIHNFEPCFLRTMVLLEKRTRHRYSSKNCLRQEQIDLCAVVWTRKNDGSRGETLPVEGNSFRTFFGALHEMWVWFVDNAFVMGH